MNSEINIDIKKKKYWQSKFFKIFIVLIIGIGIFAVVNFLRPSASDSQPHQIKEIRFDDLYLNLSVGDSTKLNPIVKSNENDKIHWNSSDESVAVIDENGLIIAIKPGKTLITAKLTADVFATIELSVSEELNVSDELDVSENLINVKDVDVNTNSVTLVVGGSVDVIAVVTPSDATNKKVTWSSLDSTIATVNDNGKITAKKEGKTTVTVMTVDGSFKKNIAVVVKNAFPTIPFALKNFEVEKYNNHVITKEETIGYNDNFSISITNTDFNDARLTYVIKGLVANELYRLEVYIKGENIVNESKNKVGALLCSDNWETSATENIGTFDWRKIRYVGRADDYGKLQVQLRLGFSFNLVKGKVYFDNLTLAKYSDKQYVAGSIRLDIDNEDLMNNGNYYIADDKINIYAGNLNKAYQAFYDLTGLKPFGGKRIDIMFNNYLSVYAFAGNPIQVNKTFAKELFTNLNNNSWDMGFGILHEISHNFDNPNWNFEGEFWANTKMMYVLDIYNFSINVNGSGKLTGKEIISYYKTAYDQNLKNGIISYDGVTYLFAQIKDKYGWDIFKQTFRYFNNLTNPPVMKKDKFILFINKLSEYSKKDIKTEFFSDTAWNTIINDLNNN